MLQAGYSCAGKWDLTIQKRGHLGHWPKFKKASNTVFKFVGWILSSFAWSRYSFSCCSANCSKNETIIPAFEQSYTNIEGEPIHDCNSYKLRGMYCVKLRLNTQISPFAEEILKEISSRKVIITESKLVVTCWFWHAVSIIMKKYAFVSSISSKPRGEATYFINGRIEHQSITSPESKILK